MKGFTIKPIEHTKKQIIDHYLIHCLECGSVARLTKKNASHMYICWSCDQKFPDNLRLLILLQ